jgi:hypothetical protein
LVLACNNKHQYERSLLFFCETINRWPAEVEVVYRQRGRRMTDKRVVRLTINQMHRLVWGCVTRYKNNVPNEYRLLDDRSREGLPLTWGEVERIYGPWRRSAKKGKATPEELAWILGRDTCDACTALGPQPFPESTRPHGVDACRGKLAEAMKALMLCDLKEEVPPRQALAAFRNFQALCSTEK